MTLNFQFACRDAVGGVRVEFFDFLRYAAISLRDNPLASSLFIPEILGVSAIAADLDYIAVRYFVSKVAIGYDVLEQLFLGKNGKFAHGYDQYLRHESGIGLNFSMLTTFPIPSVYPLDWREPWMYDQDYRSEWAISRDYDSLTAILVEYGLTNIS